MTSLLEAAAAISVTALLLAMLSASLAGAARLHARASSLSGELFAARQLEQLADRATLAAGAGPSLPAAVSSSDAGNVVFGSDQNGDGVVDTTSAETTALEIRHTSGENRVRVRFGRQTMTVLEAGGSAGALRLVDRNGLDATAAAATLVELSLPHAAASAATRTMLFSLPARTLP